MDHLWTTQKDHPCQAAQEGCSGVRYEALSGAQNGGGQGLRGVVPAVRAADHLKISVRRLLVFRISRTQEGMNNQTAPSATSSFTRNRVEAGVPTGGEFAATRHAEANITLGAGATLNEKLARYTTPEKFVEMAHRSAAHHARHHNQAEKSNFNDWKDIAQEAMLQVMRRVDEDKPITDFGQLVNSVAWNVTVRATANKFRAEDRKAYRNLEVKRNAFVAEHARSWTQKEDDAMAQEVLDEWHDDRHKPSKDFRTPFTVDRSLDATFGDEGGIESTLGATLVAPESSGHYIAPDSYMDQAFTALEQTGAAHKAAAKRLAWNAIAERAEIPLALAGTVSQRQVTNMRAVMDKHNGGVLGACKDWSDDRDNEATAALFAPFGDLDVHGQDKVVSLFEQLGAEKANDMWANALAFANNKHS